MAVFLVTAMTAGVALSPRANARAPRDIGQRLTPAAGDNDAGQQVASGVYFYRLAIRQFTKTKKMALLK